MVLNETQDILFGVMALNIYETEKKTIKIINMDNKIKKIIKT